MRGRRSCLLLLAATLAVVAPLGVSAGSASAATASISVTVVDAVTLAPVPYACAEAWLSPSIPTTTGPFGGYGCAQGDGVVTITGLTAGTTYYLKAQQGYGYSEQWAGGTTWYDATGYSAPASVTIPVEKLVTVSGTVRHADLTPAAGVSVAMVPEGAGRYATATSGPDGTWSVTAEPGLYSVSFTDQGYTSFAYGRRTGDPVDFIQVPARTSTVIDDVLPTPTLVSGTVLDAATGQPLPGVCASVVRPDDTVNVTDGYGCTDASGTYTLSPSVAGPWVVQVTDPTGLYAYERGPAFDIAVGQQVTAASISLTRSATITGTVVDAVTGLPLNGVCAYAYAGPTGIFEPGQNATCSGVDGRWTTAGVHPGATVVVSFGDDTHVIGYAPAATTQASGRVFTTSAAATTDVGAVRLHKGATLTGRITDSRGRPVVGATVATGMVPAGAGSLPYPGPDWTSTTFTAQTDAQGRYTLNRIDPMRQAVVVYAAGQPLAWQWSGEASDPATAKQLTFAYDRTTRFDAELQPAASVTVTIKGATGPGTISAYTTSGAAVGWTASYTADGTYVITGLPRSTVLVAAGNANQRAWYDRTSTVSAATRLAVRPGKQAAITLTLP